MNVHALLVTAGVGFFSMAVGAVAGSVVFHASECCPCQGAAVYWPPDSQDPDASFDCPADSDCQDECTEYTTGGAQQYPFGFTTWACACGTTGAITDPCCFIEATLNGFPHPPSYECQTDCNHELCDQDHPVCELQHDAEGVQFIHWCACDHIQL